ncbi:hypothetical protein AX16_001772 [Volvariella volvacea WC 439]|nr:hypothetical protein AX16_001772 [Volvariella volvacea WC 439]
MKSASPLSSSWLLRSHRDSPPPRHPADQPAHLHLQGPPQQPHLHHQPPLTPTYTSPRSPPIPPNQKSQNSAFKAFHSVFRKQHHSSTNLDTTNLAPPAPSSGHADRAPSVHSGYSADTTDSDGQQNAHPYAAMHIPPIPVVSNYDPNDEEADCPVCLEPLSSSFRLPGEKPHIVPECGHALHEACFTAVYGPIPKSSVPRKTNLGVCGVCRRPMKVGDSDTGKSNKLAALTGMGDKASPNLYPGRETPTSRRRAPTIQPPYDPNEDDPIEHPSKSHTSYNDHPNNHYVVAPSIQVRPEFSSLTRTTDLTQPLTCIVIIELPGKRPAGSVPGAVISDSYTRSMSSGQLSNGGYSPSRLDHQQQQQQRRSPLGHLPLSPPDYHSGDYQYPLPPQHIPPLSRSNTGYSNSPSHQQQPSQPEEDPFAAITEDLRNRIIDWKGHPLSDLGPLQMYDLLSVRRDAAIREFYVYLFKEAIICVVEEKKKGLGRLLSNASGGDTNSTISSASGGGKGVLRLKGRIYVKHIKNVTASSAAGEMSLTIDMEDELASFILIFRDRSSLEGWRSRIQQLVDQSQGGGHASYNQHQHQHQPEPSIEEFGGSSKAMRMLSGSTVTTVSSAADSLLGGSTRSTLSSSTSHGSLNGVNGRQQQYQHNKLGTLGEDDELMAAYDTQPNHVTPYTSGGPSNNLPPLPHPPMDLILVISIPPPTAPQSTAQLKIRVIKATLDFVLASLGPKDRLSMVTFEVGTSGKVRKTPFLCPGKPLSKARLEKFIDEVGLRLEETQDEFLVRGSKDEKTDVVTAVNHGFDVVLQRKGRNPVSGMILVSDASDSTRRAQMDLVLARAEAANVPIHSFGYGRSHDPASLWLMSNNTSGTYTFVKDWYDLRSCVAGCIGGMMSMGVLNMKLHFKVVDGYRFRIRKISGGPPSVLSSDGLNVDIEVGELRYGERKEMLVELELDNSDMQQRMAAISRGRSNQQMHQALQGRSTASNHSGSRHMNATDQFVHSMGLDSLAIDDTPTDLADGMMDRMIDEVPVIEVDGSFFDPAASKNVSRLAHPVLLTVTLLPMSLTSAPSYKPPTPPGSSNGLSGGVGASQQQPSPNGPSDPVIVRRRMELLASDMITRALVLVSRRNFPQAKNILNETRGVLNTVLQTISRTLPPPPQPGGMGMGNGGGVRNRKEVLTLAAIRAIQAILQDLGILMEALDENVDLFAHDQRNFGAQQAMILRDQKSWSGRSATERLFWTIDHSIELVSRSMDWVSRD